MNLDVLLNWGVYVMGTPNIPAVQYEAMQMINGETHSERDVF